MNNCFAFLDGKCLCLNPEVCETPCRFYKSKEQLQAQKAKAADRLDSLPADQRDYIREKYYKCGSWR